MLPMDEQAQTMNIEERRVVAKPTEALEDISLDEIDEVQYIPSIASRKYCRYRMKEIG